MSFSFSAAQPLSSSALSSSALWGWLQGSQEAGSPERPAPQPLSSSAPGTPAPPLSAPAAACGPCLANGGELSFGPLPPTPSGRSSSAPKPADAEAQDAGSGIRGSPSSEIPAGPSLNTGTSTPLQCPGIASSSTATSYRSGTSTPQPHSPAHGVEIWAEDSPINRRPSGMSSSSSTPSSVLVEHHAQAVRSRWRWMAIRSTLRALGSPGAQRLTAYFGQKSAAAALLEPGSKADGDPISPLHPQHSVSALSAEEQTLVAQKLSRHAHRIGAKIQQIVEDTYSDSLKHKLPLQPVSSSTPVSPRGEGSEAGSQAGEVAEWLSKAGTGTMPALMTSQLSLTNRAPRIIPPRITSATGFQSGSFKWPVSLQVPPSLDTKTQWSWESKSGSSASNPSGPWPTTPGTPSPYEAPAAGSWSSLHEVIGPLQQKLANKMAKFQNMARSSSSELLQAVSPHLDSMSNVLGMGAMQGAEGLRGATYRSTVVTSAGHSYEGTFKDGNMQGYGRLVWPDGHWFQGEFEGGETCGMGVRVWQSGHAFVGQDVAGRKEGLGVMTWPDGRRYEGGFKSDIKDGLGLMLWPPFKRADSTKSESEAGSVADSQALAEAQDSVGKWYFGFWARGLQHGHGLELFGSDVCLVTYHLGKLQQRVDLDPQLFSSSPLTPSVCFQNLAPQPLDQTAGERQILDCDPTNLEIKGTSSAGSGRRRGNQRNQPRHVNIESKASEPPLVVGQGAQPPSPESDYVVEKELDFDEVRKDQGGSASAATNGCEGSWVFKVVNGEIVARPQHMESPPMQSSVERVGTALQGRQASRVSDVRNETPSMDSPMGDSGDCVIEDGCTEPEPFEEGQAAPGLVHRDSSDSLNSSWDSSVGSSDSVEKRPMRTSDRIIEIMQGGSVDKMVDKDVPQGNYMFGLAEKMFEESERETAQRLSSSNCSSGPSEEADAQFPSSSSNPDDSDTVELGAEELGQEDIELGGEAFATEEVRGEIVEAKKQKQDWPPVSQPSKVASEKELKKELWEGALAGSLSAVSDAVSKGADLSWADQDDRGNSALHKAARAGHCHIVNYLLEANAELGIRNVFEDTPLHAAAYSGHKEVVELLVDSSADLSAISKEGESPLHCAAFGGHSHVCRVLVEGGGEVDLVTSEGDTALHMAAISGSKNLVLVLLDLGATKEMQNQDGCSALDLAEMQGHLDVVEALRCYNGPGAQV